MWRDRASLFDVFQCEKLLRTVSVLMICIAAGCVSQSKSTKQARDAFLAGQRSALIQQQQLQLQQQGAAPRALTVTLVGPVKNPVVGWTEGLTLSQAIVYAGYNSDADPGNIIIRRNGEAIVFDPERLLSGEDFPLEAGDVVEIRQ